MSIIFITSSVALNSERYTIQLCKKMSKETKRINNSDMVIVNADKTGNKYEVSASDYKKLLHENITRDYKMDRNNKLASINQDTLDHAQEHR